MTRLNNLLIDGDDAPGGIPTVLKKVEPPLDEAKKEGQPTNAKTNEVIGQKMAAQAEKKPSVTDFEVSVICKSSCKRF